ncbi:MAG: Gfo/Idh/MocA family oxidoreductase [Ilumatobacteraceae bacterium]|nr:Gfo/Idh/MocA family oxidoreductase [Ilumatobacteraceae bacterium]
MQHLRIGIIGVGGMGTFHANTLGDLADVSIAAVSDPHLPNAEAVSDRHGAAIVDDPFELIRSDEIDALVIASPDDTHAGLALAALERGLPTLCEKPLATTVEDARSVVEAEVALGRRLIQLGFMREYDPAHRQLVAALAELGRIDHVRAFHRNANTTRRTLEAIIVQSMVHDVHSVRFLTGAEITSVHVSGAGADDGSFRHIGALCRLSDGAHAFVEFDDGGFAYEVGVEVLTRTGDALTSPPTRAIRRHDGSVDVHLGTDWFGWFADAYRNQDQAWVTSIRAGEPTGPSTWDGYRSQQVVGAIRRSLDEQITVPIEIEEPPPLYR